MRTLTYLITGGAGFIGSHLARHLLDRGHHVVIIDDLSTGKRENLPQNCEFYHADAGECALLADIIAQVDGVFHLAAIASVERSNHEWLTSTRSNLLLTVAVLEAIARRKNAIPFVVASSAAVYGNNPDCPLNEMMHPTPITAYGVDKYASEYHARIGSIIHGIPTTALRFFNVYGERQDPTSPYSGVISIFARAMLSGNPLFIYGDGTQQRDFIYVADVCRFVIEAMHHMHQAHIRGEVAAHYCFNVGTGHPTTINNLMHVMQDITGSSATVTYSDTRKGDIYKSYSDMTHTHHTLQLHATTPLREGLMNTLTWVKDGYHE
jgi:UDP-glucose 4-epimerase